MARPVPAAAERRIGRPMSLPRSENGRILTGVGLAAAAQAIALFLSGSGEGWNAPMWCSFGLWLIYPITLMGAPRRAEGDLSLVVFAALAAPAADYFLVRSTLREWAHLRAYVHINRLLGLAFIGAWLFLWSYWQYLALRSLIVGPMPAGDDDRPDS
jgi:hypothetical protein